MGNLVAVVKSSEGYLGEGEVKEDRSLRARNAGGREGAGCSLNDYCCGMEVVLLLESIINKSCMRIMNEWSRRSRSFPFQVRIQNRSEVRGPAEAQQLLFVATYSKRGTKGGNR